MTLTIVILVLIIVISIISNIIITIENRRLEDKIANLAEDSDLYKNLFEKEKKLTTTLKQRLEKALSKIESMKKPSKDSDSKIVSKTEIKPKRKTTKKEGK